MTLLATRLCTVGVAGSREKMIRAPVKICRPQRLFVRKLKMGVSSKQTSEQGCGTDLHEHRAEQEEHGDVSQPTVFQPASIRGTICSASVASVAQEKDHKHDAILARNSNSKPSQRQQRPTKPSTIEFNIIWHLRHYKVSGAVCATRPTSWRDFRDLTRVAQTGRNLLPSDPES